MSQNEPLRIIPRLFPLTILVLIMAIGIAITKVGEKDIGFIISPNPAKIARVNSDQIGQVLGTASIDDNADNWPTLTNPGDRYLIKYMPSWEVEAINNNSIENGTNIKTDVSSSLANKQETYRIFISEVRNPEHKNLKDLIGDTLPEKEKDVFSLDEDRLGPYKVYKIANDPLFPKIREVFFKDDEGLRYISISLIPYDRKAPLWQQDAMDYTFNLLLSTFRFLD